MGVLVFILVPMILRSAFTNR